MARTNTGGTRSIVVGNYNTLRLVNKVAVANQSGIVADRIPLPQGFRVSQVCFIGYTVGGTVTGVVSSPAAGTIATSAALVSATSQAILTASLTQAGRSIPRGSVLDFVVTAAGAPDSIPKGGFAAFVTGYFRDHLKIGGPFAESGQSSMAGPVAGYIDVLPLVNLASPTPGAGDAQICEITTPYDCRVQAIAYDSVGLTGAGSTIRLQKSGVDVHTPVTLSTDPFDAIIDNNSSPAFATSLLRDWPKGTVIRMMGNVPGAQAMPISTVCAYAFVWVKGHVNATYPATED